MFISKAVGAANRPPAPPREVVVPDDGKRCHRSADAQRLRGPRMLGVEWQAAVAVAEHDPDITVVIRGRQG